MACKCQARLTSENAFSATSAVKDTAGKSNGPLPWYSKRYSMDSLSTPPGGAETQVVLVPLQGQREASLDMQRHALPDLQAATTPSHCSRPPARMYTPRTGDTSQPRPT